jgi:MFS family permease
VAIAAVCVHASIGQLYAFSVFNRPLTRVTGVTDPGPADWTLTEIAWIFGLANALAGLTTAVIGTWIDRLGPRLLLFAAALCFGGGFWSASCAPTCSR